MLLRSERTTAAMRIFTQTERRKAMKTIKAYRILTGKSADSPRTVVFATDKAQAKLSATLTDAGRYCDCNDIYAERAPELDKYYDKSKGFELKEETL